MKKINARGNKALCLAIAMIIALALLPVAAAAAGNTLNLSAPTSDDIKRQSGRFEVVNNVIEVTGTDPITIKGDGTSGFSDIGWAVDIKDATDITIENDTKIIITNAVYDALAVRSSGATITGKGSGITISNKYNDGAGIWGYNDELVISGTIGDVSGGWAGIGSSYGSVTISGKVDSITGGNRTGDYQITASSYAVLDYTDGGLLNPARCLPVDPRIVTFEYVLSRPGGVSLKKAYITNGQKIPVPTAPGVPTVWYADSGLTTPWDFNTPVTGNMTLYARAGAAAYFDDVEKVIEAIDPTLGFTKTDFYVENGKVFINEQIVDSVIAKIILDRKLGARFTDFVSIGVFSADVEPGEIAQAVIPVEGSWFVGVSDPKEIKLLKIISPGSGELLSYTANSSEFVDGKFTLEQNGVLFTGEIDPDGKYDLIVFITDGGTYDLDREPNGIVIDPLAIVSEAKRGSGGGCNGGAGALGILALAFALRAKRKAKTAGQG